MKKDDKIQIIIIPGFGESGMDEPYKKLKNEIESSLNKNVIFYNPVWNRKTIENWITDFDVKFKDYDLKKMTVIGFSMGAYITLALSNKYEFKKIIVASLSPYFKENIKDLPKEASKFMGKKRMKEFANVSIPKEIKSSSIFLFGEQDWPIAISQAKKMASLYGGKFISIKNTGHELNSDYIQKITVEA
jgi:predicted alpha/beta hydrolase family esterase